MREIVLDTETTGVNPLQGDRIAEIGCVELFNHLPTGKTYHVYINPDRDMPDEAARIHGLTNEFLADKPVFSTIVDMFLDFIADTPLVIHNAPFDMGFLNMELTRHGFKNLAPSRAIDTLPMARRKFPGAPASLDALCKRFGVDNSARDYHGALLDAQLLAEVYLELCGGRQPDLEMNKTASVKIEQETPITRTFREARLHKPSETEQAEHEAFLGKIKNALWLR